MIRFHVLILPLLVLCSFALSAQAQNDDRFAKIENQKVAYITKHLNLSTNEAQRFFPLYNQYTNSMRTVKTAKSTMISSESNQKRDVIEFDAKEVELKKQYRARFAEVIGAARASQFFVIEQEFKDMLYKEWQSRQK